ncbi:MAG: DUF1801 domain-containing protein [Armatimonadetes bacterium]|nr:DUF1801 domain-containing protein [Armatimonadota bacterium]
MTLPEPPEYAEFLAPYPAATQALARGLREKLVAMLPPCIEILWDATNTAGPSYGFTDRNADHFIHLPTYTSYVNIGFTKGTQLDDPEGRLVGFGASIRHIRLTRVADLDDPYVQGLVRQACDLAPIGPDPITPRTVIRVMNGPKRRPRPST